MPHAAASSARSIVSSATRDHIPIRRCRLAITFTVAPRARARRPRHPQHRLAVVLHRWPAGPSGSDRHRSAQRRARPPQRVRHANRTDRGRLDHTSRSALHAIRLTAPVVGPTGEVIPEAVGGPWGRWVRCRPKSPDGPLSQHLHERPACHRSALAGAESLPRSPGTTDGTPAGELRRPVKLWLRSII
jgi:hypothetical protein